MPANYLYLAAYAVAFSRTQPCLANHSFGGSLALDDVATYAELC